MSQSDNPFSPPVMNESPMNRSDLDSPRDSFSQQVPIVGILMIVQGALETFYSLFCFGIGFFSLFAGVQQDPNVPGWMPLAMIVFGAVILVLAILRMFSGYFVFRVRRRILAIVTNCLGLGTMLSCYCAPSAIAICIYSLVVLFQPSVVAAFARNGSTTAN